MTVSFDVDDVSDSEKFWIGRGYLKEVDPRGAASVLDSKSVVEAAGGTPSLFVDERGMRNGLLDAIHNAYASHFNLTLSPDHLWLTIVQGLARWIASNPNDMFDKVMASGDKNTKQLIKVDRDTFALGSESNDWQGVFNEMSAKTKELTVPGLHDKLVCDFTTTGPLEAAISSLAVMDSLQSYISYQLRTMCGIPNITLTGTPEDWKNLRKKAEILDSFGMQWWTEYLYPFLDEFVIASEGCPDIDWWRSLYKDIGGSGSQSFSGRINSILPFSKKAIYDENWKVTGYNYVPRAKGSREGSWDRMDNHSVPAGVVTVPFVWNYLGSSIQMKFLGGLSGYTLVDNNVTPALTWAVLKE